VDEHISFDIFMQVCPGWQLIP